MKRRKVGASLGEGLASRQILVVTGKGGVGKSAVAGALGRVVAETGRRVLLLETDPRESLHQFMALPPSAGAILEVAPRLFLQNLHPGRVLDELVREQLHLEALSRRVLASPIYRHFADAAPGLKEIAVLGHAYRVVHGLAGRRAPRVDTVVLDAPATGHGVSLLAAPSLAAGVIHSGPFGRMAAELSAFVADRDRCGIVVVTLAEEMPAQEALDLQRLLSERFKRRPELLVVNGLYPSTAGMLEEDALLAVCRKRREINEQQLARLLESWRGPVAEMPLLPYDRGPELLAALQVRLAERLAAIPSGPNG